MPAGSGVAPAPAVGRFRVWSVGCGEATACRCCFLARMHARPHPSALQTRPSASRRRWRALRRARRWPLPPRGPPACAPRRCMPAARAGCARWWNRSPRAAAPWKVGGGCVRAWLMGGRCEEGVYGPLGEGGLLPGGLAWQAQLRTSASDVRWPASAEHASAGRRPSGRAGGATHPNGSSICTPISSMPSIRKANIPDMRMEVHP